MYITVESDLYMKRQVFATDEMKPQVMRANFNFSKQSIRACLSPYKTLLSLQTHFVVWLWVINPFGWLI